MFTHIIDNDGYFVEDAFVSKLTEFTIKTPCPDGFYRPRWDGAKWVEGMAQAEIDSIKNSASLPTIEERIKANEDALLALMEVVYDV